MYVRNYGSGRHRDRSTEIAAAHVPNGSDTVGDNERGDPNDAADPRENSESLAAGDPSDKAISNSDGAPELDGAVSELPLDVRGTPAPDATTVEPQAPEPKRRRLSVRRSRSVQGNAQEAENAVNTEDIEPRSAENVAATADEAHRASVTADSSADTKDETEAPRGEGCDESTSPPSPAMHISSEDILLGALLVLLLKDDADDDILLLIGFIFLIGIGTTF